LILFQEETFAISHGKGFPSALITKSPESTYSAAKKELLAVVINFTGTIRWLLKKNNLAFSLELGLFLDAVFVFVLAFDIKIISQYDPI
jgi:hypothetical protein